MDWRRRAAPCPRAARSPPSRSASQRGRAGCRVDRAARRSRPRRRTCPRSRARRSARPSPPPALRCPPSAIRSGPRGRCSAARSPASCPTIARAENADAHRATLPRRGGREARSPRRVPCGAMTDLTDRLVIKDGNVFAVVPRDGEWSGADGVWMDDCRHVSRHELRIDGALPARAATPMTTTATPPSTTTRAARGWSARVLPTAPWSSASWPPAFIELDDARGRLRHDLRAAGGSSPPPPRDAGHRTAREAAMRRRASCAPSTASPPRHMRRRGRVRNRRTSHCDDERFGTVLRRALLRSADAAVVDLRRAVLRGRRSPGTPRCSAATASSRRCRRCPFAPEVAGGHPAPARRPHRPRGTTPSARRSRARSSTSCDRNESGTPLARYYGSVDATPLFLRALSRRRATPTLQAPAATRGRRGARVDRPPRPADLHRGRAAPPGLEGLRGRRAGPPYPVALHRAAGLRWAQRRAVLAGGARLLRDGARAPGVPGPPTRATRSGRPACRSRGHAHRRSATRS